MPEIVPSTCSECGGDGLQGDEFCVTCMGCGAVPVIGINRYLQETLADITDKVNDIKEKCNDIFEKVNE